MQETKPDTASAANPVQATHDNLSELLASAPLHSRRSVRRLFLRAEGSGIWYPEDMRLHCETPQCNGMRRHKYCGGGTVPLEERVYYSYAMYSCEDCKAAGIIFGIKAEASAARSFEGICTKIYQEPQFGHPIPKRLFQIIGEANREYFLQARRAIARSLGVGAYAYYRRIVENTKFELVKAVLDVAKAANAAASQIQLLTKAQSETQFSKAIEMLAGESAIPPVLLIDGHNPLSLLHDLLSEGIHQYSDAECLQRAQDAEVILCEIADRMQIALTEHKAVKTAITNIMNRKATGSAAGATS